MNYFDVLVVISAGIALIALYQLRPCALILAGNNLLVSRALSAIDHSGRPSNQRFLPAIVFSEENLQTAATILTISLATLFIFFLVLPPQRKHITPAAPRIPQFFLVAVAIYLVAVVGSTATMFTVAYGSSGRIRYDLELGGAHAFLCSLLIYELARRRLLGELTARRAFSIAFLIFGATGFARGGTGLTTGNLVASAILLLPRGSTSRLRDSARTGGVILSIIALSFVVRGVRTAIASEGTHAVGAFIEGVLEMEDQRNETGVGAENVANASQSAAHMLECITLYDGGVSRQWRSIYSVVEYTLVPSFFTNWFGWTRSIEPAIELTQHFIHGGGVNVLGELYWNGGWLCVVIVATAISLFCSIIDRHCWRSPFWLMMVAQFAPSFLMGYGYGFPQVARGAINGLLAAGCYVTFAALRGRAPDRQGSVRGPLEVG